jgi:hypothetical protein
MKQAAIQRATQMKRTSNKYLMEVLRHTQASEDFIPATGGLNTPYTEDDNWLKFVLKNPLPGFDKLRLSETGEPHHKIARTEVALL